MEKICSLRDFRDLVTTLDPLFHQSATVSVVFLNEHCCHGVLSLMLSCHQIIYLIFWTDPGLVILVETSSSNGTNGIHFTLFSPLCSPGLRASKECKVVLDDRGQSEEKSMICLRNLKFSNF